MELTLFPENACVVSRDEKDTTTTDMNTREELLRRPTDCRNIREVKLEENGFFACLVLQLGDRLVRLLSTARCEVNLRVV